MKKKIFLSKNELFVETDKKYIVTCEAHNEFVSTDSFKDAQKIKLVDFCNQCRKEVK